MSTSGRAGQVGVWGVPLQSGAQYPGPPVPLPFHVSAPGASKVESSNPPLAGDEDSDSGEETENKGTDVETLQAAIFGDYAGVEGTDDLNEVGVAKIRGLLVAAQSGGAACLICLERVRGTDPVWDCKAGCHAIFHLICIQSWARQSLNAAEQRALSRLSESSFPGAAAASARWHCPKCRAEYLSAQIPREYRCFCGKEENPGSDPWLAPHTCGERCGRQLEGDCGHECKLLCHPGACPPCPQLVKVVCFCEATSEVRRCGRSKFSCGDVCKKTLACGKHTCSSVCHGDACPPCTETSIYPCRCKREVALRPCLDYDFQCERPCEQELSCKKHWCKRGCHAGSCGDCELAGTRTCPCGKVEYKGVACDTTVPTCGSTCEKMLSCSLHRCQERCHTGPCNNTCRIVLNKACHCGGLKKEVPCHQELQCDRKCQRIRDCTRHACRRRCCDGDCPPCSEVCGRRLRCGNHRCPSPCHRGACSPCPITVKISCACGVTSFDVPCGMERDQKPPRCAKRCQIPPRCSHGGKCKPHACHYGPCPPCLLPCNSELSCGHKCKKRCHGPRPDPNPEYTLKLKKKKRIMEDNNARLGLPCPPCSEIIVRQCLGEHLGIEKMMVCSEARDFPCGNPCGNMLDCGNHFCMQPCHSLKIPHYDSSSKSQQTERSSQIACDQCILQCQKKNALCSHPCPLACHPGDCPPCKALVKQRCYCETLTHVFDCDIFSTASHNQRVKMLSCGGPCHRKLPNCAHMCSDICHPGSCQMASNCRKKVCTLHLNPHGYEIVEVVVRCACLRLKKEWLCLEVQAALMADKHNQNNGSKTVVGLIPCDPVCLKLVAAKRSQEEAEQLRQRKAKESEVNSAPATIGRRKRTRHQFGSQPGVSRLQVVMQGVKKWVIIIGLVIMLCAMIYYGYQGLLELNAWMNRRDAAKLKRKPRRSTQF